jgi:hypothetical protein
MQTLFDSSDRQSILARVGALEPSLPRQWGKMNVPQMLAHCSAALETGTGDRPMKQALIGKILAPFITKTVLGEKPMRKNSPTDPTFVMNDERNFEVERERLKDLIQRFAAGGAPAAAKWTHSFFGKLSGEEWGRLMYKHLDHHLQQFGV